MFGWGFTVVFPICRHRSPKLDSEKGSVCVSIYSVLQGCACRWGGGEGAGGDLISLFIYICPHVYTYCGHISIYKMYMDTYIHIYIYMYMKVRTCL